MPLWLEYRIDRHHSAHQTKGRNRFQAIPATVACNGIGALDYNFGGSTGGTGAGGVISFVAGAATGEGAIAGDGVGTAKTRFVGEDAVSIVAVYESEYIFTPAAIMATTATIPTAIHSGCFVFPEKLPE